jgi:hypothetical protein
MGLKALKIPEAVIEFPGGNFTVRGLNLDDVAFLVNRHGEQLQQLFASMSSEMAGSDGGLDGEMVQSMALPLLRRAPRIMAEAIACAAGDVDEETIGLAQTLPFPVQLEAIQAIARLTFDTAGGPKKLVETVIQMAQGTTGLLQSLQAQPT